MAKLGTLAKLVKLSKQNLVAESFVNDLVYTIEQENKNTYTPTRSYKPSGISGCMRSIYYQLIGITQDEESAGYNLTGICESGTNRHEDIQNYVMRMKDNNINCEWIDVEDYLVENPVAGTEIVSKQGNETKCMSTQYNLRFLCDGLIKYNGELYILEIKTESTHKYAKHDEPFADHKMQASCYSLCLGVNKVIFVYEDRDNCSKKGYLVEITEDMRQRVVDKINTCNSYIEKEEVPPRELDKCMYCNYKEQCRRDGI